MNKKETTVTKGILFKQPKINFVSNILNIISSVILFVVFAVFIIFMNSLRGDALAFACWICIPLLLSIKLKFVFCIINDIVKFKIIQDGLLFLMLNILALVFSIIFFIVFKYSKNSKIEKVFNKYLYFIISLICLIVAIFAIIERIRKKNTIHLFFLVFYTLVFTMSLIVSISFLITINKKKVNL